MIIESLYSYCQDRTFLYQLTASLATYYALKLVLFFRARKKRYQLMRDLDIPGPEASLLDGHLYLFSAHDRIQRLKVHEELLHKYGGRYGLFIGDEAIFITSDLDILKQVFFERMNDFKERSYVHIETELTDSILMSRHNRWRAMRRFMLPSFSRYTIRGGELTEFIEVSVGLMLKYIEDRLETRDKLSGGNGGSGASIDIHDLMKSTALHMISAMAIKLPNVQVKEEEENVKSLDGYLSNSDGKIMVIGIKYPFLRKFIEFLAKNFTLNRTIGSINNELNKTIDKTLQLMADNGNYKGNQMIDNLIRLHKEGKLTRNEVIGNAQGILFAGYDTTSTTMAYFFWCLAKHPEVQERLRDELMTHGMESKYLTQALNETMRLYPTVSTFTQRLATSSVQINNQTIPQGTKVIYHASLIHRDPAIWPEPEKYDPERFAEGREYHPCAFAPFGLGERKCLGYQLALLEMKTIACEVLLRYRLRLRAPEVLRLVSYASVLTKPSEKIMIDLEKC